MTDFNDVNNFSEQKCTEFEVLLESKQMNCYDLHL